MLRLIFKRAVILLWGIHASLYSQVINIENKRFFNDTNGWVGHVDFSFNINQNTQQVLAFSNSSRIQYRYNRSRTILFNDVSFIKAGNTNFVNSGYQHLRYNYKVNHFLTMEVFTQTQYNPVLKLDFRYLLGYGPRFKLVKKENAHIYFAALYMYEFDDIVGQKENYYENRISTYLTLSLRLFKTLDVTSTTFYQPNMENGKDYRIANDSSLEIFINKYLNYKSSFNVLYDTRQPEGIPDLVYVFRNGLTVKF